MYSDSFPYACPDIALIASVCFLITLGFNLCGCFQEAWYSYQSDLKYSNREELVITGVATDENVMLDFNVTKWTTISTGSNCYTAGIMDREIVVLFSTLNLNQTKFHITPKIIGLADRPIDVILLETRNRGTRDIFLVVAYQDLLQIDWYIIQGNDLNIFWNLKIQYPVVHMNAYQIKDRSVLLLASSHHNNSTTVDLYDYTFKEINQKYRIRDSLDLPNPVKSSAFNNFEDDYYLSIPQSPLNLVLIFKCQDYQLINYTVVKSVNVKSVVSFDIGFKTFLAFDGVTEHSGIYQFTKDGILREKIVNSNWNGIHYLLPIPIMTYWDDIILFAQRTLDHQSHNSPAIDILTYNGGKFEEHEDIPCSHFGEQQQVLTCLQDGNGIIGSSYISVGDHIGLIVPKSGFSLLFIIHSTIKEMKNPKEEELNRLAKIQDTLKKIIEYNNDEYEKLKNLKRSHEEDLTIEGNQKNVTVLSKERQEEDLSASSDRLDAIGRQVYKLKDTVDKIAEQENSKEFNTITINGDLEIQGEAVFKDAVVDRIKEVPASVLLEDIVRKDAVSKIKGKKTLSDVEVVNITFERLNELEAKELVFDNGSPVTLNGNINFTLPTSIQSVHIISRKINNIDVEHDIIYSGNKYNDTLKFDQIKVREEFEVDDINNMHISSPQNNDFGFNSSDLIEEDTILIPENMTVNNINGENVQDFLKELCLVNIVCYIPDHIKINGNIVAEDASIEYLNELKFPEEYLMKDASHHSNITGKKIFLNSLTAKEIRSRGTIDGVDTKELITLSTNQEIPGKIVFGDITVAEELNVTGRIFGEHIDKFLPNPTLEFVDSIKANVNFKNLEVNGDIVVENSVNKNNLMTLLNDLVYKDEEKVTISAQKDFPMGFKINEDFIIGTNSINNINLDLLVSKDTDQILAITFLKGDIIIDNLFVSGLHDGENVTQLDEDLVRLDGTQYISSTLVFREDIEADNFELTGTLNDLEAEQYLYIDVNQEIDGELEFENIEAMNIFVEGDIDGQLTDIDLDDLSQTYLSYTKEQTIDYYYNINHSVVDDVNIKRINGIIYEDLFNYNKFMENIRELIANGQIKVENLYVDGSMQIDTINDHQDHDWLPWNTFLNESSNGTRKIAIADDVYFETLEINRLSYVKWNWFNKQLVHKSEVDVEFTANATKTFTNGFKVNKLIETKKINGIPIRNILKKAGSQKLKGPVIVKGDVFFKDDVTVNGYISGVLIDNVLKKFTVTNGTYNIKGDMVFRKLPHIYNLEVDGQVNDKNIISHFAHIVNISKDSTLYGQVVFENTANISGNFNIAQNLNNINLWETVPRIVLTTEDADIQGLVSFSEPVIVRLHLYADDLETSTLLGIDLDEWKNNSIFVDKGLLPGIYKFDEIIIKDNLRAKFINDVDINSLIPLRSNQSIPYLEFEEITVVNNITVGNLVNGYNISDEFRKTFMANLDQNISSNIIFEKVILIRQFLSTPSINGQNVSKIVTLNTDQNITSVFNFNSKCRMNSDFDVHGLVNGVNISDWNKNAIIIFAPTIQEVYHDWNISKNLTFKDDVKGGGLLGGWDFPSLMEEVNRKKSWKSDVERVLINVYENLCEDVTYLYESARKQIYKFQFFDELQTISFKNHIEYSHYFEHANKQYLLVNDDNCDSHLYIFNSTAFDHLSTIKTGHVAQVALVHDGDIAYLVTRTMHRSRECDIGGTYTLIWQLTEENLTVQYIIEYLDLLQESLAPGTFYGLNTEGVVEFKLSNNGPKKYRKWDVSIENAAFVPRGLRTGLALRTGNEIIFLDRTDPVVEYDFDADTESIIIGRTTEINNHFMPGRDGGDLVVTNVGVKSSKKNLLAVATHEETSVKGSLDFVKIYQNPMQGDVFHKVPTYKPSSLVSIEFDQGETLLAFMENERTLQIYEYKGIEGFKHRTSANIKASKLFLMTLPIEPYLNPRKALGIMHEKKITILQSVMVGNQISDELKCGL